jgi:hypothetical protein
VLIVLCRAKPMNMIYFIKFSSSAECGVIKANILRSALHSCGRPDLAEFVIARQEIIRRNLVVKAQHGT